MATANVRKTATGQEWKNDCQNLYIYSLKKDSMPIVGILNDCGTRMVADDSQVAT
jgi:hypothetical protein